MTEIDYGAGSIVVALRSFVASSRRSAPARRSRHRPSQRGAAIAVMNAGLPESPRVVERRRTTPITSSVDLNELPARVLLDRLTMPVLAVGLDGVVAYANPACATLLGHKDAGSLEGRPMNLLLVGESQTAPSDCVAVLKSVEAGAVTTWRHADGFPVSTIVSQPLLRRDDDQIVLVAITDVSDTLWSDETAAQRLR